MHDGGGWTGQGALGGAGWNTDTPQGRPSRKGPLEKWPSPRSPARVDGDPGVSTCPVVEPPCPPTAHNHSGALWGRGGREGWHVTLQLGSPRPGHPPGLKPGGAGAVCHPGFSPDRALSPPLRPPPQWPSPSWGPLLQPEAAAAGRARAEERQGCPEEERASKARSRGHVPPPPMYASVPRESWAGAPEDPQGYP